MSTFEVVRELSATGITRFVVIVVNAEHTEPPVIFFETEIEAERTLGDLNKQSEGDRLYHPTWPDIAKDFKCGPNDRIV